jgi:hypothetical protein
MSMDFDRVIDVVNARLSAVLAESDYDLVVSDDRSELDITTDHWTIHLAGGGGFLAIDDEPAEAADYATARRRAMGEKVERELAAADRELDGAISAALTATGDPFSLDFVTAIQAIEPVE